MDTGLRWYDTVCCDTAFSCWQSRWHRFWHSFTVEERGPPGTWCRHDTWTCSCGKKWKIDLSWVEGTVYIRAEELKEEE